LIARLASFFFAAVVLIPATVSATVIKAEGGVIGRHLADNRGFSLYLFEKGRDSGQRSNKNNCVGDCLILWSPVPGDPFPTIGNGLDATLVGSFRRSDGTVQATYNGRLLYYFGEDLVAGDINGHQFEEFGGVGYLVTPTGRELGGQIAGKNYQGGEDCVCHENTLPQTSPGLAYLGSSQ
jgi:predicted lipoprotein with Yx(FWY)xxD motif